MKKPRHPPPAAPPREDRGDVERTFGLRAGLAILARRPGDVERVAVNRAVLPEVERLLGDRFERIHVGLLEDHQIEKLARSNQHEGLCLEAKARRWAKLEELGDLLARGGHAIALDRVRNSYNIGAIVRSAAFFGIEAVLLGAPAPHPGLDPNAIRVAEGGCEHVVLARTTDLADTLTRLRARGAKVYGADGQATTSALDQRFAGGSIVVLGNEREGMGPRVRAQCDGIVAIRGSGSVESLNVGVAAGILLAQLARAT